MKRILLALLVALCLFAFTACGSTVDLSSVESKLDQLQDRIAELETENGKLKTDVADLHDENGKLKTDIADLYDENGKLKTDIEELISSSGNGLFDWDNPIELTVAEICIFETNIEIAKQFFGKVVLVTGIISSANINQQASGCYSSLFVDVNDSAKRINLNSAQSFSDCISKTVIVECIYLGGGDNGVYSRSFDLATIIEVLD